MVVYGWTMAEDLVKLGATPLTTARRWASSPTSYGAGG